ncbi:MAG: metallophosphoesterase family protein [Candidatus Woesearchaeota archaeon]
MKFAHIADVHLGAWREPALRQKTLDAFSIVIEQCIAQHVDFVCIAGDLFNTALPSIDILKETVRLLQKLKQHSIPVYCIAGSHDYSASGKTMLDVLEEAQLLTNVMRGAVVEGALQLRPVVDAKTGYKITGILGKAGMYDQTYYQQLDTSLLDDKTIFLFHTALLELMPPWLSHVQALPISSLPPGCYYYAGGHIHVRSDVLYDKAHVVFPGPVFPASMQELEHIQHGSFVIVDNGVPTFFPLKLHHVQSVTVDVTNKTLVQIQQQMQLSVTPQSIVLLTLQGYLQDITFQQLEIDSVVADYMQQGAFVVLRNTAHVRLPHFEQQYVEGQVEVIEQKLLETYAQDDWSVALMHEIMDVLSVGKQEGETVATYEQRISDQLQSIDRFKYN